MIDLKLTALPGDLENIRRFAPRTDGGDHLPRAYQDLGFNPLDGRGALVTGADLNALGVPAARLPAGVALVKAIVLSRRVSNGPHVAELSELTPGVAGHVSANAADYAIRAGLAVLAP